jgi:hypothetical protein
MRRRNGSIFRHNRLDAEVRRRGYADIRKNYEAHMRKSMKRKA